jgi:hypothetical protein
MATNGNKNPGETEDLEKQPEKPKKKSRWKRRIRMVLGLIVIALLSSTFMLEYVKPNEFGIVSTKKSIRPVSISYCHSGSKKCIDCPRTFRCWN